MLSDALWECRAGKAEVPESMLKMITFGCVSASHAGMFLAYTKQLGKMKELSTINHEIAQMVVSADDGEILPEWFMVEIVRDLPRLVRSN